MLFDDGDDCDFGEENFFGDMEEEECAQSPQFQTLRDIASRLRIVITPALCQQLADKGYAVADNAFGPLASQLRQDITLLHSKKLLRNNRTYYKPDEKARSEDGSSKVSFGYSVKKPHIMEAELDDAGVGEFAEEIPALRSIGDRDNFVMGSILNERLGISLDGVDVKMQVNEGEGGCFPMHIDTAASVSKRQITALLYLNPGWKEEDGGQIRLYPFPYSHVDINPIHDRLVLFSSKETLHRVLPSSKLRVCVTMWFTGPHETASLPSPFIRAFEGQDPALQVLVKPSSRMMLSKVLFADEWAQSVKESFGECEETQTVLRSHWAEVERIKKTLSPDLLQLVQEHLPIQA
eukprot:TRINITY_DN1660_c0_g1_i1.p1 TRINITY_DN1660_c0_g1~~TRINITY_DN1660_c0_g1_i1.p1  ORF type:complete len:350 (-),score=112.68 TRINITY_DN1660_c0_g1_i1:45-1094(-)